MKKGLLISFILSSLLFLLFFGSNLFLTQNFRGTISDVDQESKWMFFIGTFIFWVIPITIIGGIIGYFVKKSKK